MRLKYIWIFAIGLVCWRALPSEHPEADQMQRLILLLGTDDYEKREAATESLIKMGKSIVPFAENFRTKTENLELRVRIKLILSRVDPLHVLCEDYKAFGLPMPPPTAHLVTFEDRYSRRNEKKRRYLALRFKSAKNPNLNLLLVGTNLYEPNEYPGSQPIPITPTPKAEAGTQTFYITSPFPMNSGIFLALQCKIMGWDALAEPVFKDSMKFSLTEKTGSMYSKAKAVLVEAAWVHWQYELLKPKTDRARIYKYMRKLHNLNGTLGENYLGSVINSLEATIKTKKSKPGSVEALINDLTEIPYQQGKNGREPRITKLLHRGFEAIPALIHHVQDTRLTRTIVLRVRKMPTHHQTVGEIVSGIFQDLDDDQGVHGSSWAKWAHAWWLRAKKVGEEKYLLKYTLPSDEKRERPNSTVLTMLAGRYPKHLPQIYRRILNDRPHMQSYPVVDAIMASSLPADEKIKLFLTATDHTVLEHRRAALWKLKDLDHEKFVQALIDTLDALPKTPKKTYWMCTETSFTNLVMGTPDPRAWKGLLRAARRVDSGLRMEFMTKMTYTYIKDRQKLQRLNFLAAFLNDHTTRSIGSPKGKFDGFPAAHDFPKIEIRNFAAMQIATILNITSEPKPTWNIQQWEKFRVLVQKALKK